MLAVASILATGNQLEIDVSIPEAGRFPPLGLLASAVFFIGVTAVWGFIERIGAREGFTAQDIANVLALSLSASVFAAVVASVQGVRYTRHWPIDRRTVAVRGGLFCH